MKKLRHNDWALAAVRVAEIIPLSALHPELRAWAEGRTRAVRAPWAIAFSGGADSLALLLLLWAHFPRKRADIIALHFNHRLRGAESRADAAFCRKVCRSLGLRLVVGAWKRAASTSISEASARTARMAFFDEAMSTLGAKALFCGHQLDDVAETIFMRLARGSGTPGLAAPRPVQALPNGIFRLRPLLSLKKSYLCGVLKTEAIPWCEDSSNAGSLFFRNRVRGKVIPSWIKAAPDRDALAGAGLARELLQEDDDALEAWLEALKPLGRGPSLNLSVLLGKPKALWRRALHRWVSASPYRGALSRQGFEALLQAVMTGKQTRQSLGREGFAEIRGGFLRYSRNQENRALK